MVRELLFKAKDKKTGQWIEYGTALHADRAPVDFDPETECQYTGVKNKQGVMLWENDIVALEDDGPVLGVITFFDGCFVIQHPDNRSGRAPINSHRAEYWRVVGNTIDNPDILG